MSVNILGSVLSGRGSDIDKTSASVVTKSIPYRHVRQFGVQQVLLIDPVNRNIEDLKILGEQIKESAKDYSIAMVQVYDNLEAANLLGTDFPDSKMPFYKEHWIGTYTKNNSSKTNRWRIYLPDAEGGPLDITY